MNSENQFTQWLAERIRGLYNHWNGWGRKCLFLKGVMGSAQTINPASAVPWWVTLRRSPRSQGELLTMLCVVFPLKNNGFPFSFAFYILYISLLLTNSKGKGKVSVFFSWNAEDNTLLTCTRQSIFNMFSRVEKKKWKTKIFENNELSVESYNPLSSRSNLFLHAPTSSLYFCLRCHHCF